MGCTKGQVEITCSFKQGVGLQLLFILVSSCDKLSNWIRCNSASIKSSNEYTQYDKSEQLVYFLEKSVE